MLIPYGVENLTKNGAAICKAAGLYPGNEAKRVIGNLGKLNASCGSLCLVQPPVGHQETSEKRAAMIMAVD